MAPRRYMKPLLMQKNNGVRILQIHMINEFPCPSGAEKKERPAASVEEERLVLHRSPWLPPTSR